VPVKLRLDIRSDLAGVMAGPIPVVLDDRLVGSLNFRDQPQGWRRANGDGRRLERDGRECAGSADGQAARFAAAMAGR